MYITRPPQPALRPFVKTLWAAAEPGNSSPPHAAREHVLPTGDMHLVFRLSSEPLRLFDGPDDGCGREIGRVVVGGARSTYYVRDARAPSGSVGAVLRPGAAALLFGGSAEELAQRHTRLDDVWGRAADIACQRMCQAGTPEHKLAVLELILASRLPRVHGLHPAISYAIEQFEVLAPVEAVVERTGYSHRHFVATFRKAVGLKPKTYCRILRFQKALKHAARDPAGSWTGIALAAGYSDQAHFNRDFREFAGMTPSAYRRIAPVSINHVPLPGEVKFLQDRWPQSA